MTALALSVLAGALWFTSIGLAITRRIASRSATFALLHSVSMFLMALSDVFLPQNVRTPAFDMMLIVLSLSWALVAVGSRSWT